MDRTAPVLADATCITVLVNLVSQLLTAPTDADSDDEDKFNVFINGQKGLHLILVRNCSYISSLNYLIYELIVSEPLDSRYIWLELDNFAPSISA